MGADYFQVGSDFAEYCSNKYAHNDSFKAIWNEYSKFGLFEKLTCDNDLCYADKLQLMKGLGYGTGKVGILFSVNVQLWACIMPLLKFGSDIQLKKYLFELTSGKCIGAHAISEPETGSDVFDLKTFYERKEDGYHLHGTKCFVSNAPMADMFLIYARKKDAKGFANISCFLVDRKNDGLYIGDIQKKMGMNESPFGDIGLSDCVVPHDMCLGKEGQGMNIFNYTMIHERPLLLAFQVGIMERQFDDCLKYVKTRSIKNKAIIQNQSVSNRIADMKVRLYIANLILEDYLRDLTQNARGIILKSSMAKLSISEMLCANCMDAMRNYGTLGYIDGYNAAVQLKDSLGSLFYSGTSDVQRNIISSLV